MLICKFDKIICSPLKAFFFAFDFYLFRSADCAAGFDKNSKTDVRLIRIVFVIKDGKGFYIRDFYLGVRAGNECRKDGAQRGPAIKMPNHT